MSDKLFSRPVYLQYRGCDVVGRGRIALLFNEIFVKICRKKCGKNKKQQQQKEKRALGVENVGTQ